MLQRNSLNSEQLEQAVFGTEDTPDAEFWSTIGEFLWYMMVLFLMDLSLALAVPQRPVSSIYHFVRRAYQPNRRQGPWTHHQDNVLMK
jgi:hypothetical protein